VTGGSSGCGAGGNGCLVGSLLMVSPPWFCAAELKYRRISTPASKRLDVVIVHQIPDFTP
jgi:hypothetical protein